MVNLLENSNNGNEVDQFPDSPTAELGFGVYANEEGVDDFLPTYYPSKFKIITEKELERTAADCEGERVSIDKLKNSEFRITGKVHASDLKALDQVAHSTESVEVITPVIVGGGMEAFVKSTERGDMIGYDAFPTAEEWMFEYSLDLVSTGADEYDNHSDVGGYETKFDVDRSITSEANIDDVT